jgi:hypothetical protein
LVVVLVKVILFIHHTPPFRRFYRPLLIFAGQLRIHQEFRATTGKFNRGRTKVPKRWNLPESKKKKIRARGGCKKVKSERYGNMRGRIRHISYEVR